MAKLKYVLDGNGTKFYPITIANGVVYIKSDGTQVKLSEFLNGIDYTGKADKVKDATNGNFAGLDANGNLTDSGKKADDFATADQGTKADSAIQSVKVNGAALTADSNKAVDVLIATGSTDGTLSVNNADVAVKGLGSAAYTESSAYDAAGAASDVLGKSTDTKDSNTVYGAKAFATDAVNTLANGQVATNTSAIATINATESQTKDSASIAGAKLYADDVKSAVIGASTDASSANTIYGAKKYADEKIAGLAGALIYKGTVDSTHALPTEGMAKGDVYVVKEAGTYASHACEVGDYLIYDGSAWDAINGENQVEDKGASLTIGTAVTVATVDGTDINVTQVEDTTKLECEACSDTTDYADVSDLFKA